MENHLADQKYSYTYTYVLKVTMYLHMCLSFSHPHPLAQLRCVHPRGGGLLLHPVPGLPGPGVGHGSAAGILPGRHQRAGHRRPLPHHGLHRDRHVRSVDTTPTPRGHSHLPNQHASVNLVMGCPNARAGAKNRVFLKKKPL